MAAREKEARGKYPGLVQDKVRWKQMLSLFLTQKEKNRKKMGLLINQIEKRWLDLYIAPYLTTPSQRSSSLSDSPTNHQVSGTLINHPSNAGIAPFEP
ncbi:hypothetical protein DSO57_1002806 [Entomophthora muscae]|uniref:Uncharacterized protein n=1 Tax=Entomophthora muscae TaxID=34485 RepID=A0ACC2SAG8_9FUNG|nr:hypothetical protein DSO57_1002806 [Entomophthora muscae]